MVSLFFSMQRFSLYLSATNGNRFQEAVIKVERKPTNGLKHIGRNSTRVLQMRQEGISCPHNC